MTPRKRQRAVKVLVELQRERDVRYRKALDRLLYGLPFKDFSLPKRKRKRPDTNGI